MAVALPPSCEQVGCGSSTARAACTDLCRHDMGPALDHHITVDRNVRGRDRHNPRRWGVRLQTSLLHDGRAAPPDDAIRAHGGEGTAALLAFLGDL